MLGGGQGRGGLVRGWGARSLLAPPLPKLCMDEVVVEWVRCCFNGCILERGLTTSKAVLATPLWLVQASENFGKSTVG